MMFIVQFKRLRRGVPEVIREFHVPSVDGAAALAAAQGIIGTRHWPVRTDALRVMDDGGRTLLDWTVPAGIQQPSTYTRLSVKPAADRIVDQHELRKDLRARVRSIKASRTRGRIGPDQAVSADCKKVNETWPRTSQLAEDIGENGPGRVDAISGTRLTTATRREREATARAASSSRTAVRGDLEPKEPVMVISRRLVQVQHIALLSVSLILLVLLIAMPLWG
jgi:hypothetical protein